jgi:nucleoside-diphosphate-sugar epimerase
MKTVEELEAKLAEPSEDLIRDISRLDGDILILGIGGKMGPSLARLAKNAIRKSGSTKKVIGVSRFSSGNLQEQLEADGIDTITADLLNENELRTIPDVKNVIYMAGTKFGTTGKEYYSWAMNAYLPGRVAEKYRNSRIVVFSTGNVYPFTPVYSGGATETTPPAPIGEYGQSCLGRERLFEYFSEQYRIPATIFRLNYAIDLRYGVLHEIAKSVKEGKAIDLGMGHFNCIWQGDANEMAIRALTVADSPPQVLNISGPETLSVRWVATLFGEKFGKEPIFVNEESDKALLSNCSKSHQLFGYPKVTTRHLMEWVAEWIDHGGPSLNKPTHFQEREGKF